MALEFLYRREEPERFTLTFQGVTIDFYSHGSYVYMDLTCPAPCGRSRLGIDAAQGGMLKLRPCSRCGTEKFAGLEFFAQKIAPDTWGKAMELTFTGFAGMDPLLAALVAVEVAGHIKAVIDCNVKELSFEVAVG